MITEVATFYLKADASLANPNSAASKVIRELIAPELTAHGSSDIYYGQFIEKPEMGVIFAQWESIDAHRDFINSSKYEAHVANMYTILDSQKPIQILHIPFVPSNNPSPALGANPKVGATEVVFIYFPSTLPISQKAHITSSFDQFRAVVDRSDSLAMYGAWALEEAVPNPGPQAAEGETSKAYMSVVGWEDVDAHNRFMGGEDFQANIHLLTGITEVRFEIMHVKLQKAG